MRDGRHRGTGRVTWRRAPYSRVGAVLCAAWALLCFSPPCRGQGTPVPSTAVPSTVVRGESTADPPDLDAILARYNAVIERESAVVESLRVLQTMIEPQEDGSTKTSEATLVYTRDSGMERRVVFSEITHPAGDYTLESLIGPELRAEEYDLEYAERDTIDGEEAHHIRVTAIVRDRRHFDGDIWISTGDLAPVRIIGQVADPPFPVVLITLDKSFALGPSGLRLLRRHSGEVEVNLLFGTRRGLRHIFYDDYSVQTRAVR